jgi:hypothetical protein
MKNNNLPPIALQLDHPDATFYRVGLSESTVSGLFQAHDNDQPFEVGFEQFLESCYKCGILDDVQGGTVYIVGDRTDRNARQWATDWLQENAGTENFFKVIADAVQSEFDAELAGMALTLLSRTNLSSIGDRLSRDKDAEFCDAVTALAGIIRANEAYKQNVIAAQDANQIFETLAWLEGR